MHALKAQVKNGRLVLDEPTDLPEGREVEIVIVDDEFEPEERARLLQAIEDGEKDIEKGDYVDGIEFANELLARREASSR
jgi:predicted DNA-binding antitoxin AbrB/MazE fold protein